MVPVSQRFQGGVNSREIPNLGENDLEGSASATAKWRRCAREVQSIPVVGDPTYEVHALRSVHFHRHWACKGYQPQRYVEERMPVIANFPDGPTWTVTIRGTAIQSEL